MRHDIRTATEKRSVGQKSAHMTLLDNEHCKVETKRYSTKTECQFIIVLHTVHCNLIEHQVQGLPVYYLLCYDD